MTLATEIKTNIGVFTNPKHDLYVAECEPTVAELAPGPGEVTVHIRASGICGSDIHFQKEGCIGPTMVVRGEHILGHESSGEVIQVHPSVKDFKVGDKVAVEPGVPCQNCDQCMTGHYNGCPDVQFKSTPPVPGFLRRYVKHPARYCYKIDDLTYEEGALLEPMSVALYGIEQSGVKLSDPVLICGAGPIGLMSAILARAAGASPLVITDIDSGRLEYAKKVVPHIRTVLVERGVSPEQVAQKVIAAAGLKPRVCIECTGVESSISVGIYSLEFAGTIHVVGVGKDFQNIPFMHLSVNEITMKFQYRYANTWPKCIRLLKDKLIEVDHLVTHRFNIEDSQRAFETSADVKSGAIKVMILDD